MNLRTAVVASVVASLALASATAHATPSSSGFGPAIEGWSGYEGQTECSPWAKPGVLAFRSMVLNAYPGTGAGGIGRACNVGGQSEHKEGRAWDWTVNVAVPHQKAAAESLIEWLTEEDRYGNDAAMAKRLGIMYLIWDRKIWGAWGGWSTYCKPKPRGCVDPDDGGLRHPHTDHVHFSFTKAGAWKRTTYWNKDLSFLSAIESSPYGYWGLGRNGSVTPVNSGFYGDRADKPVKSPVVDIAGRPVGDGYWLLSRDGKVKPFGEARFKGSPNQETNKAVAMAATPSGKGYWVLSEGGRVFAFGDAGFFGGVGGGDGKTVAAGIAPTATGMGYWIVTERGRVVPFGDAVSFGGAANEIRDVRGIEATSTGLGYRIFNTKGRVLAFGDAQMLGGLADKDLTQDVVGLAPTPTGLGYWLLGDKGKLKAFGDASSSDALVSGRFRSEGPPPGLTPAVMPGD